ncbi:SUMF1/EgtB/PvdO family nonheme iron enzyme [Pseudonocardia sp. C8]|uniref:Formylglycine-generating enzyme family protein n=2 Tax=Saccharopolyspora cebuensis TaxID=418759 RepID=A0ABV4CN43_9PSEU|nr:SUMF1/EgtB/PvdO family nonheme iron enzyme [Pseudonocardia sp. C8]MBC3194009.1 SUMF1/EgtB/PvdO family nonheme iron enzyme [Pseudonocardia sp. C8]
MSLDWIEIPGGTCLFGDQARPITVPTLLWTRTPITQAQLGDVPREHRPATHIDQSTADRVSCQLGGRLPRSVEWEWMASGAERRVWPWGNAPWGPKLANLRDSGYEDTTDVAAHPEGATPDGMLDVAGNVWEWTASSTMGDGFVIRGGSYASPPLYARCTFLNSAPAELRSPGIGFRVVREP